MLVQVAVSTVGSSYWSVNGGTESKVENQNRQSCGEILGDEPLAQHDKDNRIHQLVCVTYFGTVCKTQEGL